MRKFFAILCFLFLMTGPAFAQTASLAWDAVTGANYNIYRSQASGAYTAPLNANPITALTYTDATVIAGQQYFWVVRAVMPDGSESGNSNEVSATIPAKPTTCPDGQFLSQYFANMTFAGSPTVTRCETSINNYWPAEPITGIPGDNFSVRWAGNFAFNAGRYTFTMTIDDGMRVWVDNNLILESWMDQGVTDYSATVTLAAGKHAIKVEFYDDAGEAYAKLNWKQVAVPPPPPANLKITITTPIAGATIPRGVNPIHVDGPGAAKISLYRNGTLLKTVNAASLDYAWRIMQRGTYTLSATARDVASHSISTSISVKVQ